MTYQILGEHVGEDGWWDINSRCHVTGMISWRRGEMGGHPTHLIPMCPQEFLDKLALQAHK